MNHRFSALLLLATLFATDAAWGENPIAPFPVQNGADVLEGDLEIGPHINGAQPAPAAPALENLPSDAQALIASFDKESAAIRQKAQQDIAERQKALIAQLQKLQDAYSKPGSLDEAVAVRDRIRQLKSTLQANAVDAKPDPGTLQQFRGQVGKVLHFQVKGDARGIVWGTAVYSDDSRLATAAVHAGIVRDGQQAIVKVTVLHGQHAYAGSENNGVVSHPYPNWAGSYRVEAP